MQEVIAYYNAYDEDGRLFRDNVHKVEYLTTIFLLDKYVKPCSSVLDASAGTGRYSFYLAEKGHDVTAGDIVPMHVGMIREKRKDSPPLKDIRILDARDLSVFAPESFDAVLCMGPIYHLKTGAERKRVIAECLRVLKTGGILFTAYINRQAAYLIELKREGALKKEFLDDILYKGCQAGARSENFYFTDPKEIEAMMLEFGTEKICDAGVDGISYMLSERINRYDEADYKYWMQNHIRFCTDEHLLGYSLHGLYIGRKTTREYK